MVIKCPICGTRTTWQENPDRPFCSSRCRLIDLGKWASDEYRVPGKPQDAEDEMPEAEDA